MPLKSISQSLNVTYILACFLIFLICARVLLLAIPKVSISQQLKKYVHQSYFSVIGQSPNYQKSQSTYLIKSFNKINQNKQEARKFTCQRPTKIFFLRVHKAGSTTLQNFFIRYSFKYNLFDNLSRRGPSVGGYPGIFNRSLHKDDVLPTDIIYDHVRYDEGNILSALGIDANKEEQPYYKKFAIVRDPKDLAFSSFNYFYQRYDSFSIHDKRNHEIWCAGSPYYEAFNFKAQKSFGEFINLLMEKQKSNNEDDNDFLASLPWNFRANNSMTYDFGNLINESTLRPWTCNLR